MTDTLHTRLLAAVQQRMDVARAAMQWTGAAEAYRSRPALGPFFAANDPATVLRHCERDLALLGRHAPEIALADETCCAWCREPVPDERGVDEACRVPWPCAEITDLAAAYGVDVDG